MWIELAIPAFERERIVDASDRVSAVITDAANLYTFLIRWDVNISYLTDR
jgi:hypothetical protein